MAGNPFVTADTTRDVVITTRLAAANELFTIIEDLMYELSIWRSNEDIQVGQTTTLVRAGGTEPLK
jgi:phosphoenolpyruvate carboxylase